ERLGLTCIGLPLELRGGGPCGARREHCGRCHGCLFALPPSAYGRGQGRFGRLRDRRRDRDRLGDRDGYRAVGEGLSACPSAAPAAFPPLLLLPRRYRCRHDRPASLSVHLTIR